MSSSNKNAAQERFDETYITASDLQRELRVSRAAVMYARKRGALPEPITVNDGQLTMWERVTLKPFLDTWIRDLNTRRGFAV